MIELNKRKNSYIVKVKGQQRSSKKVLIEIVWLDDTALQYGAKIWNCTVDIFEIGRTWPLIIQFHFDISTATVHNWKILSSRLQRVSFRAFASCWASPFRLIII